MHKIIIKTGGPGIAMAHQLLMDMEFFPHPGTRKIAGFEIPSHRVDIWEVRLKFLLWEVLGSLIAIL